MREKPVLVVMAAGMGSRYGGLKQIDPVGSHGEAMLDYSLYDAREAGFEKAVIIIKEAIRQDFLDTVGKRLENSGMELVFAYQETDMLPEGYALPEGRVRPWGTGHAVLCAADAVGNAPFAVINADDYYGKSAFSTIFSYLSADHGEDAYCMVGYRLDKTVSDHGFVSRGVCSVDDQGKLTAIIERTRIEKREDGIAYTTDNGESWTYLPPETPVSMNMWGFQPGFMDALKREFPIFLDTKAKENPLRSEFFLPFVVECQVDSKRAFVQVLSSPDQWYGVTYAEDKPLVAKALADMALEGKYPINGLWN